MHRHQFEVRTTTSNSGCSIEAASAIFLDNVVVGLFFRRQRTGSRVSGVVGHAAVVALRCGKTGLCHTTELATPVASLLLCHFVSAVSSYVSNFRQYKAETYSEAKYKP